MKKTLKSKTLEDVSKEIERCQICRENKIGLPVSGEGRSDAKVVFVGEAPGKEESKTGRPFVGRSGKLLRQLILEAGLLEKNVFITSAIKYLPEHVTPTPDEIVHGRKHLFEQLQIINPKIVVLLGRVAAFSVLEMNVFLLKDHGKIIEKDGRKYLLAYHPAAPLHSPKTRVELLKDFKKLKKLLSD